MFFFNYVWNATRNFTFADLIGCCLLGHATPM